MADPMRVQRDFGACIRRLRLGKGWHLDDLAHRLGKSRSSISRIEQGKQNLSMADIAAMAEVLDVPVAVLFGGNADSLVLTTLHEELEAIATRTHELAQRLQPFTQPQPPTACTRMPRPMLPFLPRPCPLLTL